jgi:isoleucyl-tRNA synthetase
MYRTPEVIDCWFDSGSMPLAQRHYPFEHKDDFDNYFLQTLSVKVLIKQEVGSIV